MAILDPKFKRLTTSNVDKAPRKAGVYALYAGRTLVYLGHASGRADTLRSRLRTHLGAVNAGATRYKREVCEEPEARCKALLAEHVAANGVLPTGNARKR